MCVNVCEWLHLGCFCCWQRGIRMFGCANGRKHDNRATPTPHSTTQTKTPHKPKPKPNKETRNVAINQSIHPPTHLYPPTHPPTLLRPNKPSEPLNEPTHPRTNPPTQPKQTNTTTLDTYTYQRQHSWRWLSATTGAPFLPHHCYLWFVHSCVRGNEAGM